MASDFVEARAEGAGAADPGRPPTLDSEAVAGGAGARAAAELAATKEGEGGSWGLRDDESDLQSDLSVGLASTAAAPEGAERRNGVAPAETARQYEAGWPTTEEEAGEEAKAAAAPSRVREGDSPEAQLEAHEDEGGNRESSAAASEHALAEHETRDEDADEDSDAARLRQVEIPSVARRVKVYEMEADNWEDRGTGYFRGAIQDEKAYFVVYSEVDESILLKTRILREDVYTRQEETLIVWQELDGRDIALSFQESEGRQLTWDFLYNCQRAIGGPGEMPRYYADGDDLLNDDLDAGIGGEPVSLPDAELGNLPEIEEIVQQGAHNLAQRDLLVKAVVDRDYVTQIINLFETCEDLESVQDLHRLCTIMKSLILINDVAIFECILKNEQTIIGVAGVLEYDPEFQNYKADYRAYLQGKSRFRQVVEIKDKDILHKIHSTFRLQYFRDVILARILDDPIFSILNTFIFFNQVDIVQYLQNNEPFMNELFGLFDPNSEFYDEKDMERRDNAVLFVQQFIVISKSLQASARSALYTALIQHGLLKLAQYSMSSSKANIRNTGTDIMISIVEHDPTSIRQDVLNAFGAEESRVEEEANKRQKLDEPEQADTFLSAWVQMLHKEPDIGIQAQVAEAVRVLLDPTVGPIQDVRQSEPMLRRLQDPDAEKFLQCVYDNSINLLFQPLLEPVTPERIASLKAQDVSLLVCLCDLLTYFVRVHGHRAKYFMITTPAIEHVRDLFVLAQRHKHLRLAALKLLRKCLALSDEFYIRHAIKAGVILSMFDSFFEMHRSDNLLTSACLEMFEYIRREGLRPLIVELMEQRGDRIRQLEDIPTFMQLALRYEQYRETDQEAAASDGQDIRITHDANLINGKLLMHEAEDKSEAAIAMQEEAYFDASDDEGIEDEDNHAETTDSILADEHFGTKRTLVDYDDDDDDDADDDDDYGDGSSGPKSARVDVSQARAGKVAKGSDEMSTGPDAPTKAEASETDLPVSRLQSEKQKNIDADLEEDFEESLLTNAGASAQANRKKIRVIKPENGPES